MTPTELSPRQRDVLAAIDNIRRIAGFPPSIRELCLALGVSSTNAVADHLKALEKKGAIQRDRMKARSLRLTRRGRKQLNGG